MAGWEVWLLGMFLRAAGSVKAAGMGAHTCCQLWVWARVLRAWHDWGALSTGKRMVAVFVGHEFCLCGICYLPALSSTPLPPLETYFSESQASPLSDLWLISVHAERLSQAHVLSCPFFRSLCAFHYSNELYTAWATAKPPPLPSLPASGSSHAELLAGLLSQPHQFFIDLLLDLWSLSQ